MNEEKKDFGEFYFRRLKQGDIEVFATNMREGDRKELKRWAGNTEHYELKNAVELSDVLWVGCFNDGSLMSMFGGKRANMLDESGVIWELSTNEVNRHKLIFAKGSKIGFDLVCKSLPDVREFYNFVDGEYESAVNWIRWLGGEVSENVGFNGRCGGVFRRFTLKNPYYHEKGE